MKIMREMLKRRQFIFGKQNINRHQPYVDDVVIDVSDEDAVMKFAPTKKEVIDIVKYDAPSTVVFNISEEDVEFVDTVLYKQGDYDHIGYVYKLTKGSYTSGGSTEDISNDHIVCAGPVLALGEKVAFVTTRDVTESDHAYLDNILVGWHFFEPTLPFAGGGWEAYMVTDFDSHNTGVSITQLPDPSYIVNITTDVLPHIIDHAYVAPMDTHIEPSPYT